MAKRGAKSDYGRLLSLWFSNPSKALSFNEIVMEATKMGYTKRTIINYLNQLVAQGLLEKTVDIKRQTFYKPSKKLTEITKIDIDRDRKLIEKLTNVEYDFWILEHYNLGFPLQYLTSMLQITILNGLYYVLKGDFETFRQIFELWIDAGFRNAIYKMAEVFLKISDDKELLEAIIYENKKELREDWHAIRKLWRKRDIRKQIQAFIKEREKLRQFIKKAGVKA